jgi:hypothetical protein
VSQAINGFRSENGPSPARPADAIQSGSCSGRSDGAAGKSELNERGSKSELGNVTSDHCQIGNFESIFIGLREDFLTRSRMIQNHRLCFIQKVVISGCEVPHIAAVADSTRISAAAGNVYSRDRISVALFI